ncbi:cupin domain-containing protein [Arenimonas aestuarii]
MSRPDIDDTTLLAAALAGMLPDDPPEPARAASLRARILDSARRSRTQVVRADEGDWTPFLPGIHIKTLRRDAHTCTQTSLWRIDPGAVIPPHPHTSEEECLVLSGSVVHDSIEYCAGDYLLAAPGERHQAFTSPAGALLLIRGELLPDPARVRALLETPPDA